MSPFFSKENFPTFRKIPSVPGTIGRGFLWTVKKTWKPILVIVIVLAVAHSIASVILGQRLKAEIARIKATGAPVSMAELGKPKVPDAENAAIIYTKVIKDLTGMVLNPNGGSIIRHPSRPNEDLDAIERFVDASPNERSSEMWDSAQQAVAKYKHLIPLIEKAASRPKCQFPVNWEDGDGALFPHYSPMKDIAQLLCANALIQAQDGRMDEAFHSIELGFKVSESLKDEPILIGLLVRRAIIKISSRSLLDALEYGSISEAQVERLYIVLAKIDMYPGFDRAMQGQRCLGTIWIFDFIRKEPHFLWAISNMGDGSSPPNKILCRVLIGIWRPFLYADEIHSLKYWDKHIELSRLPYREMYPKRKAIDIDENPLFTPFLAAIVCPIFVSATSARDNASADVAGSQILLALQTYKGRYNMYPASLDELRSKVGWDIPEDVFSGKDFIYKRQENGFLLYSIGRNLKDDGAVSKRSKTEEYEISRNGKYYADIVWQMDH